MATEKKKFYVVVPTEGVMGDFCGNVYPSAADADHQANFMNSWGDGVKHVVVEHEFSLDELEACHEEIDQCHDCGWHYDIWEM